MRVAVQALFSASAPTRSRSAWVCQKHFQRFPQFRYPQACNVPDLVEVHSENQQVAGSGKMTIRASYGMFTDRMKPVLLRAHLAGFAVRPPHQSQWCESLQSLDEPTAWKSVPRCNRQVHSVPCFRRRLYGGTPEPEDHVQPAMEPECTETAAERLGGNRQLPWHSD